MLTTSLKHIVYDTALNMIFNAMHKNLVHTKQTFEVGVLYSYIQTGDMYYCGCVVTEIKHGKVSFTALSCGAVDNPKSWLSTCDGVMFVLPITYIEYVATGQHRCNDGNWRCVGWKP